MQQFSVKYARTSISFCKLKFNTLFSGRCFKLLSFMKSKAKSIALASAVKIEEPSGKRNVLQLPFVKVAQPTLFSSFEPSV